jgi:hypothetical protein
MRVNLISNVNREICIERGWGPYTLGLEGGGRAGDTLTALIESAAGLPDRVTIIFAGQAKVQEKTPPSRWRDGAAHIPGSHGEMQGRAGLSALDLDVLKTI